MVQFKNKGFGMKQGLFLGLFLVVSQGALGSERGKGDLPEMRLDQKISTIDSEGEESCDSLRSDDVQNPQVRSQHSLDSFFSLKLCTFLQKVRTFRQEVGGGDDIPGSFESLVVSPEGRPQSLSIEHINSFKRLCKHADRLKRFPESASPIQENEVFYEGRPMLDRTSQSFYDTAVRAQLMDIANMHEDLPKDRIPSSLRSLPVELESSRAQSLSVMLEQLRSGVVAPPSSQQITPRIEVKAGEAITTIDTSTTDDISLEI